MKTDAAGREIHQNQHMVLFFVWRGGACNRRGELTSSDLTTLGEDIRGREFQVEKGTITPKPPRHTLACTHPYQDFVQPPPPRFSFLKELEAVTHQCISFDREIKGLQAQVERTSPFLFALSLLSCYCSLFFSLLLLHPVGQEGRARGEGGF